MVYRAMSRIITTFGIALVCAWTSAFGQTAQQPAPAGPVIGKLAQTIEATTIHKTPSGRSQVYYRAKAYQYIVVNATKHAGWFGVVLENRKTGYIRADKVARLPYEVRANQVQARTQGSTTSRSGTRVTADSAAKEQILNYSFQYIGTPYVWGGNSLDRGIDCSGFVKELYEKIGINLPRTAATQALVGKPVDTVAELRAGDRLYFWEDKRRKIGHTGIFLGWNSDGLGYFIHSSSGRGGVQTDVLTERWRRILVAARRD